MDCAYAGRYPVLPKGLDMDSLRTFATYGNISWVGEWEGEGEGEMCLGGSLKFEP